MADAAAEKVVERGDDFEVVLNEKTGERRKRKSFKDVSVLQQGTQIIIPEQMEYPQAIDWLERKMAAENEVMGPNIPIPCYPFDGLVAFTAALKELFGFAEYKGTVSFWGKTPPQFISIPTSPTETIECPVGQIRIPGIDGYIQLGAGVHNSKPCLNIRGEIKRKHFPKVKELAERTKQVLLRDSIYRGKAITLGLRKEQRDPEKTKIENVMGTPPSFMTIPSAKAEQLILDPVTQQMVTSLLWTPIEQAEAVARYGVPPKRGVLLEGPYGTGKSLAAAITMRKAVESKWTFINLADADLLAIAVEMASWYEPAVIFAEDIDAVMAGEDRTSDMDTVLNVVDGIEKDKRIIIVLTTNHVERINSAFLRPGRLDAIIQFSPPDAKCAERLLRLYGRKEDGTNLIAQNEDISAAGELLQGSPAAMAREVVERSKLSAIARTGEAEQLSGQDLEVAAKALRRHRELLLEKPKHTIDPTLHAAGQSLGSGFAHGMQAMTEQIRNGNMPEVDIRGIVTATRNNGD